MNSWDKSDSIHSTNDTFYLGEKDKELAQRLIKAGGEHRKFMRQIIVSFDLTAPLYFWKEFDTYKVGTTSNSTSTMHKLATTPISLDCFETDDYVDWLDVNKEELEEPDLFYDHWHIEMFADYLLEHLEQLRLMYLKTKDRRYWKELIRWLPESWLQTRSIVLSYENIYNMIGQRRGHKLIEWHFLLDEFKKLPYANELLCLEDEEMKVKVFTLNENKRIEFTQEELEKLLDEVYEDGVTEGKKSNYFYYRYPYYTTTAAPAINVGSDRTFVTGTTIGSGDYKTGTTTSATTCKGCKK